MAHPIAACRPECHGLSASLVRRCPISWLFMLATSMKWSMSRPENRKLFEKKAVNKLTMFVLTYILLVLLLGLRPLKVSRLDKHFDKEANDKTLEQVGRRVATGRVGHQVKRFSAK
jgi:hypothetical protein